MSRPVGPAPPGATTIRLLLTDRGRRAPSGGTGNHIDFRPEQMPAASRYCRLLILDGWSMVRSLLVVLFVPGPCCKPLFVVLTTTLSVFKLLMMIFWFVFHHSNYSFFKISCIFVIIYFIIFWFMSLSARRVEVLTRVVGATNHQPEIWSINTQMCCHNTCWVPSDYRRATLLLLLWLATACNKTHRQRVPDRQRWWPYQNYEWSWMPYTIIPCNSTIAHHSLYQNNVTTL
jgi:hypothetical protein